MPTRLPQLNLIALALSASLLIACSDSSDDNPSIEPPIEPPIPELTYSADIVWTEYGIPHVTAQDWGSLGYGYAYAYARDNYCTVMREYVRAAGESARYLDGDINDDFVYKLYNGDERIQRIFVDGLPEYIVELATGYAAGLNRYLEETGVDNLAEGEEGCRGAEWVREVDVMDVGRLIHKTILRGSGGPLADFIAASSGPEEQVAAAASPAAAKQLLAGLSSEAIVRGLDMPTPEQIGSNAYAVGAQASQSSAGVLFGNPHFPWQGPERFYMSHLTMGDEYDVMGVALSGLPLNVIGFNQDVAWSHTVSTGQRFTFYELELNPDNPLEYRYDGEWREITTQVVTAEELAADGTVQTVEHTFYFSHYGAIVDLGGLSPLLAGWPNALGTLVTYRDANLENLRGLDQWIKMGQAGDLEEFKSALGAIGIPWVNTIAADRNGDAFYGDISTIPNVSSVKFNNCVRGLLQSLLTDAGYTTMDGSDSACEWGDDPDTSPGVFGYASLPKLETREYGANANDSYWLANPRMLLEGYSPLVGREEVAQSLRTRHTFDQAEARIAGTDGLGEPGFNIDNIRELHYRADNYAAQLVAEDVVAICTAQDDWSTYSSTPDIVAQACAVLADWDLSHRIDSVGAQVFWEFWQDVRGIDNLWAVPFDAADPVNTPRELNVADADVVTAVKESLASAVATLVEADVPVDSPWGEVQFDEKNGVRYPIHGGSGSMMFSVITSDLVPGEGYSDIRHGNSYIQAVTWDETDCPDAYAVLTYSQSTDPASDHYADATELYSQSGWIDMPFCEADRDAQEIRRDTVEE